MESLEKRDEYSSSTTSDEDENNRASKNRRSKDAKLSSDEEDERDLGRKFIDPVEDEEEADEEEEEEDDDIAHKLFSSSEDDEKDLSKKRSRTPKGTCTVDGYVYGRNKNHQTRAFNFRVIKKVKGRIKLPKIFPIADDSLPTYSPWIQYRLLVSPPPVGRNTLYTISEVIMCTYRPIKKKDLQDYLMHQYKMPKMDQVSFQTKVNTALKGVPKDIVCKADISLNVKDNRILTCAMGIMAPRFRGQAIQSLLPYFSYDFLSKLDEIQGVAVLFMVVEMPHVFCFWDKFVSLATELKVEGKHLFPNRNLQLDQKSGYLDGILKRMDSPDIIPIYNGIYPIWSISMLKKVVKDFKRWDPETYDFEMIRTAQRIYVFSQRERYYYKNTVMTVNESNSCTDLELRMRAVDFLRVNRILVTNSDIATLFGQTVSGFSPIIVMEPDISVLEIEFAALLREKVSMLQVFTSKDYGEEFTTALGRFSKKILENITNLGKIYWLSCNKNCSRYMTTNTGYQFQTMRYHIKINKKNRVKQTDNKIGRLGNVYIMDRLHKCGLLDFVEFLRIIPKKSQLYVFGDIGDHGPNSKRGTHHLIHELSTFEYHHMKYDVDEHHKERDRSNISIIREDLHSGQMRNIDANNLKDYKALLKLIESIEKRIDKENKVENSKEKKRKHWSSTRVSQIELCNRSYTIFCSNGNDKQVIMNILFGGKTRQYKSTEFKLWDKIQVMEDDTIGRIQHVWKTDAHGNNTYSITDNKQFFNTKLGHYSFSLFGDTEVYNTSKVVMEHAAVSIIQKYAGAASDYVIFVAGKDTPFNDLVIASKYARKDLKIFLLPGAELHIIYGNNRNLFSNKYKSDLSNKIRLMSDVNYNK